MAALSMIGTEVLDLYPSLDGALVEKWIPKVVARALTVAPCLLDVDALQPHTVEAAKGILVGAVRRLAGNSDDDGATSTDTAGPYAHTRDGKRVSDRLLTVADRDELRQLCRKATSRRRGGTIRTPVGY